MNHICHEWVEPHVISCKAKGAACCILPGTGTGLRKWVGLIRIRIRTLCML